MTINKQSAHYYVFLFGLSLAIIGLGVSRFLLSIGGMLLALNWLLEGGFSEKWKRLRGNRPAILIIILFALHLIGLWNTTNFDYALNDIRIKLPLLLFPVVLGSAKPLPSALIIRLLWLFVAVVIFGTLLSIGHYFLAHNKDVDNIREIVFFSSPIRFSLLLVIALFFSFYAWRSDRMGWWWFIAIAIWVIGFLIFLQSLTGIAVMIGTAVVMGIFYAATHLPTPKKYFWMAAPVFAVVLMVALVISGYFKYTTPQAVPDNFAPFETHSAGGSEYEHHEENHELENGFFIYRYVATEELNRAWNRNSDMDFWGEDQRGQLMRHTIIRYMSSLGLRKDSLGFAQLSSDDFQRMEQGYTTAVPIKNPLLHRLQGTYFEVHAFVNNKAVAGGSVTQRMVYFSNGWNLARENWILGVGTGDVNDALLQQYDLAASSLPDDLRRRAHNQYLTFWISFGVLGMLYFLYLNHYAISWSMRRQNWMAMAFTVIAAFSFLTEDTLETQTGATFYALLYALLLCIPLRDSAGAKFRFDELWRNSVDGRLGQ